MSNELKYYALLVAGPLVYLVVWLAVLPAVADLSKPLAILSLTFLSGVVCFVVAREKGRNPLLWSMLGALAGFVELGLIPVVIISALRFKNDSMGTRAASVRG